MVGWLVGARKDKGGWVEEETQDTYVCAYSMQRALTTVLQSDSAVVSCKKVILFIVPF